MNRTNFARFPFALFFLILIAPVTLAQDQLNIMIGGSGRDEGIAFHAAPDGDLIVAMIVDSEDLLTTDDMIQSEYAGSGDAYFMRFSRETNEIKWATYFGSDMFDLVTDMECFLELDTCVAVGSADGPLPGSGLDSTSAGGNSFFVKFNMTTGEFENVTQLDRSGFQGLSGLVTCTGEDGSPEVSAFGFNNLDGEVCAYNIETGDADCNTVQLGDNLSLRGGACSSDGTRFYVGGTGGNPAMIAIDRFEDTLLSKVFPSEGVSSLFNHVNFGRSAIFATEYVILDDDQNSVHQTSLYCFDSTATAAGNVVPRVQPLGHMRVTAMVRDRTGTTWLSRENTFPSNASEMALGPQQGPGCENDRIVVMNGQPIPGLFRAPGYVVDISQTFLFGTGLPGDVTEFLTPTPNVSISPFNSAAHFIRIPTQVDYLGFFNVDEQVWNAATIFSPGPDSSFSPFVIEQEVNPLQAGGLLPFDPAGEFNATVSTLGGDSFEITPSDSSGRIYTVTFANGKHLTIVFGKPDPTDGEQTLLVVNTTDEPVDIETFDSLGAVIDSVTVAAGGGVELHDFDLFLLNVHLAFGLRRQVFNESPLFGFAAIFVGSLGKMTSQDLRVLVFDPAGNPVEVEVIETSTEDLPELPADASLKNHPNPFGAATTITYGLARAGHLQLHVFDPLGRRVATVFDGIQSAGRHAVVWDGRTDSGSELPSGIYFYRLSTDDSVRSGRMVLSR